MKIAARILIYSLSSASGIILLLSFISFIQNQRISVAFGLLSFFILFVGIFLIVSLFYNFSIAKRIASLSHRIETTFLKDAIPEAHNILEEVDALDNLTKNIAKLEMERIQEEAQFKNLDSYRKEYLGNVSHELKTPIFNIQGYLDTLINGGINDPEINIAYLEKADKSIDRLIQIIDDLETITQLETGGLELDEDRFDLAALCKDVYSQLELIASRKKIKLSFDKKYDKPIWVMADKFRVRQVLANLVTNSVKYGKEEGETLITLNYYANDVIVEVKDNGLGIEEKHLPRLFERFYRVDKGRSREQGGTGLGLSIVKHILEAHEKSISVESKIGMGTSFTFSLDSAIDE
jgi:two-component system, OmpR family, phosphate regulon sensor histidine kinase PhoR